MNCNLLFCGNGFMCAGIKVPLRRGRNFHTPSLEQQVQKNSYDVVKLNHHSMGNNGENTEERGENNGIKNKVAPFRMRLHIYTNKA